MKQTTKKSPKEKCGACALYRAMIYTDGEDAYCGRCMKPGRVRRVRSVARDACDDFTHREGVSHG